MSSTNRNIGVFVSAYAGDANQVENNLELYRHHGAPVFILSPADAPITSVSRPDVHCAWMGEKGWAGPQTLVRHRKFLEFMLAQKFEWYLMNDADSVCLTPELPSYLFQEYACWSNEVPDLNPGASHLRKIACQPPYFFHREVLHTMLACAGNPPPSYYGPVDGFPIPTECIDHYHFQLASGSGHALKSFPDGVSFETTSPEGLEQMAWHVRERGVRFIHQVKTEEVRDRLLRERR